MAARKRSPAANACHLSDNLTIIRADLPFDKPLLLKMEFTTQYLPIPFFLKKRVVGFYQKNYRRCKITMIMLSVIVGMQGFVKLQKKTKKNTAP